MADETTHLSPLEEALFQRWIVNNSIPDLGEPDSHYDYRGYWKSVNGQNHPPGSEEHFPDTFKQHGHPTFSQESQYSAGPKDGGYWLNDQYVPQDNLEGTLLQRAQHIGPDPMAGPVQDYPGAKIGMMGAAGTPGKISGLFKGLTQETGEALHDAQTPWLGFGTSPSLSALSDEMQRLGVARAAGVLKNWGGKANSAWHNYTGHNLIPTPHGIINRLLGTNYGNGQ